MCVALTMIAGSFIPSILGVVSIYIICYSCDSVACICASMRTKLCLNGAEWGRVVAAVLGDLLQITDFQTYYGQQMLNVYYYRLTSITGMNDAGYDDMLTWFIADVQQKVIQVQNGRVVHVALEVRNLTNGIDFRAVAQAVLGAASGTAELDVPSYVSLGFKLIRESLTTRNGYKRFGGLLESQIAGNTYTFTADSVRTNIQTALAADYVAGAVTMAEPVIVKRPLGTPPIASFAYASVGAAQYTQLGTQNTRKAGRGS